MIPKHNDKLTVPVYRVSCGIIANIPTIYEGTCITYINLIRPIYTHNEELSRELANTMRNYHCYLLRTKATTDRETPFLRCCSYTYPYFFIFFFSTLSRTASGFSVSRDAVVDSSSSIWSKWNGILFMNRCVKRFFFWHTKSYKNFFFGLYMYRKILIFSAQRKC